MTQPAGARQAVERRGIELVPDAERRRRPRDLALMFAGVQMSLGALLTGALPLAIGLTLKLSIVAVLLGNLAGAAFAAAMAPIGIATASNITLASAAVFGMRGRYLGAVLTQAIDVGYLALTLVLAVPAIDEALRIAFGIAPTRLVLLLTMAATSATSVFLGMVGQRAVLAAQKANLAVGCAIVAILLGCAASHPAIAHPPRPIPHALFLTALAVQFGNALSWAPYVGDAARYVAPGGRAGRQAAVAYAGIAGGAVFAAAAGLFLATRVVHPGNLLGEMVDLLPRALVLPVVLLAALGNAASGAVLIYNGMLDLQSILWWRSRVAAGLLFSSAAVAIAFAVLAVFDLASALEAMCSVVAILLTPWVTVILADLLRRPAWPDPRALRDFARMQPSNPLWARGGLRPRALGAWAAGAGVGLFVHVFGRVDTGVPLAAAVAWLGFELRGRGRP